MFTCKRNLKGEHLFPHVRFLYLECMDDLKWKKLDVTFEVSNTRDGFSQLDLNNNCTLTW